MRVFHFLNNEFGLKDLHERRIKIARIMELNDPFEFLGVDLSNVSQRAALKKTKRSIANKAGLLCFSKNWRNPVLWGHYADKHRGMCLGFDMPDAALQQVHYVNSRVAWPDQIDDGFTHNLLFTKFAHWSYEDEYRAYVLLQTPENGIYYAPFSSDLILRQVIVGSESTVTRAEIRTALGIEHLDIEVFKARAAFKDFRVVRNQNAKLWA